MVKLNSNQEKIKLKGITRFVYKQTGQAISDYGMLGDKDRILFAVSGSRLSLLLLKLFKLRRIHIPINFDIIACFIENEFIKVNKKGLADFCKAEKIKLITKSFKKVKNPSNSFWCTEDFRQELYGQASKQNCNKIAIGHNLDDIIQTTLVNLCFSAKVETWQPSLSLFEGKITVIRPFSYLEEKYISQCADSLNLPDLGYESCYNQDANRLKLKKILKDLSSDYPFVKKNIFRSFKKIKYDYLL